MVVPTMICHTFLRVCTCIYTDMKYSTDVMSNSLAATLVADNSTRTLTATRAPKCRRLDRDTFASGVDLHVITMPPE